MRLLQLRYFIEICNHMNITKAGEHLHVSQPSLTVAIKNLEEELGIRLFNRSKQRISLTTEGEYFIEKLKPLINDLDELTVEMVTAGRKSNVLKIGIPPMMGAILFHRIFADFMKQNPDIVVEITEFGALKVQELILNGDLDLTFFIEESQLSKDIQFTPFVKRNFVLYTNRTSSLTNRDTIAFHDLEEIPLVLFNKEFYVSKVVRDNLETHGIKPKVILETTQISTIKKYISGGIASSILIEGAIEESEYILGIPIDDIEAITIGLARKRSQFITGSMQRLIDFIHCKSL